MLVIGNFVWEWWSANLQIWRKTTLCKCYAHTSLSLTLVIVGKSPLRLCHVNKNKGYINWAELYKNLQIMMHLYAVIIPPSQNALQS